MYAGRTIRRRLEAHGLTGAIFGTINAHLTEHGLLHGQDADALGNAGYLPGVPGRGCYIWPFFFSGYAL